MDVLLIDHHARRAASLCAVMYEGFWGMRMRRAYTLPGGLQIAREAHRLDLIVLKLDLPGYTGIDALLQLRNELPSMRVLVVAHAGHAGLARAALEAGAVGFIPKTMSFFATAAAIRLIAEGGIYVPSAESLHTAPSAVCSAPPRIAC